VKPTYWLIAALLSIACAACGQLLLKYGVRSVHLPSDALTHPLLLATALWNPFIVAGTLSFGLSMVLWLAALSGEQLSTVYPMAALGYIAVTIASIRLFNDVVTPAKFAGLVLIVLGVVVLNLQFPTARPAATELAAQAAP